MANPSRAIATILTWGPVAAIIAPGGPLDPAASRLTLNDAHHEKLRWGIRSPVGASSDADHRAACRRGAGDAGDLGSACFQNRR